MRAKYWMSLEAFENLLEQLVNLEESYEEMLDGYCSGQTTEREYYRELIQVYIRQLEKMLKYIAFKQEAHDEFPFVVIGSQVEIEDMEDGEICTYNVVNPQCTDISDGQVSFLSPVGTALLLKKIGETVAVQAPGGVYRYRIRAITSVCSSMSK